jgi:hypothetical protein
MCLVLVVSEQMYETIGHMHVKKLKYRALFIL